MLMPIPYLYCNISGAFKKKTFQLEFHKPETLLLPMCLCHTNHSLITFRLCNNIPALIIYTIKV